MKVRRKKEGKVDALFWRCGCLYLGGFALIVLQIVCVGRVVGLA